MIRFIVPYYFSKKTVRFTKSLELTEKLVESINENKHPLIIEKCFHGYLNKQLNYNEIKYFLNWDNPFDTFNKYYR